MKTRQGFTIVELLIMVVVIAILATITIVSYNGITNRAADAMVVGDLRNFAHLAEEYKVDNGVYPTTAVSDLDNLGFKVAKNVYGDTGNGQSGPGYNIGYCPSGDRLTYVLYIISPSGKSFRTMPNLGIEEIAPVTGGYPVCAMVGVASTNPEWGRNVNASTWDVWLE